MLAAPEALSSGAALFLEFARKGKRCDRPVMELVGAGGALPLCVPIQCRSQCRFEVAQRIQQRLFKSRVVGSTPTFRTKWQIRKDQSVRIRHVLRTRKWPHPGDCRPMRRRRMRGLVQPCICSARATLCSSGYRRGMPELILAHLC